MTHPGYPVARAIAATVEEHFRRQHQAAPPGARAELAPLPDAATVEAIVDAAFWASLRREEGRAPKISLALLPPGAAAQPLALQRPIPLDPGALTKLAPAVERPGIHLGVWRDGGALLVWGATRSIPSLCFVLEVVEPGVLVIKHRRGEESGKFANVAVLLGDQAKLVDPDAGLSGRTTPICALLGLHDDAARGGSVNVPIQLAASMRAHGRGGSLLVVPGGSEEWRDSIVHPVGYALSPPFSRLAELMRGDPATRGDAWHQTLRRAVEGIAGLTAVDGALVIRDDYEVLAFGAKIGRRDGSPPVPRVLLTEPVAGGAAEVVHPTHLGGTRHLSAAQFVHDQRGALALVASQDGRFTALAWSPEEGMVHAHRIEMLLL